MLAAATLYGCADLEPPDGGDEAIATGEAAQAAAPARPLRRGDAGPDVEWVYRFARQFGYFPNPALEAAYPGWRPALIAPPRDVRVFDDILEEAVRLYQQANGLEVTGEVDDATRALMKQPRCGVPDLYRPPVPTKLAGGAAPGAAPGAAINAKWPIGQLLFKITNFSSDLASPSQRFAITRAFARWAAVAGLSFTEVFGVTPANIAIGWFSGDHLDGSPFDGAGGVLAHGFFPPIGMLHFDEAETWSNGGPPGTFDLESVALHEIGHTLGLPHSGAAGAVMAPAIGSGTVRIILAQDDIDAIRSLYGPTFTFSWSSAGSIPGKFCTQISEPSDPFTWNDNFFCSDLPIGMAWSNAGPLSSLFWNCKQTNEPSDPHTWNDNFICLPKLPPPPPPFNASFTWSFAGPIVGLRCVQWWELADPNAWHDNYLCW